MEDDLVPDERAAAGDREQRAECVVGHVGEQLPLHLCDEFDTSSVANANDAARAPSYGVGMPMNTEGGVMKRKGSRRLIKQLGLALAVAAIAAPAAQSMPMVADSGGPVASPRLYADDMHASLPVQAGSVTVRQYADDLHASLTPQPSSVRVRRYADDLRSPLSAQPEPRGYAPINTRARPDLIKPEVEVVSADSGIEWSVATIGGIVSAFGLMLLGVGVLLAGRHSRKSRLAAA
jgi:hypothetical protein